MILSAKKLGKSTYVFSVDSEKGQVAHANFVSETARSKGIDARTWAAAVAEIVGGKVRVGDTINICKCLSDVLQAGGKPESAQGVGVNGSKADEALRVAIEHFNQKV